MNKHLRRFVETYPGSSFPTRSETTEGEQCVVKMRGAGNGGAALLSEFIVNRLAASAGLAVPEAAVIEIPAEFPWEFGTDEFYDLVRKSGGANLALAWIPGATALPAERYRDLPDELVSQIVTLDLLFENVDRTPQSRNLLVGPGGQYWIVDHGSCRFLARDPSPPPRALPVGHIFADRVAAVDRHWFDPMTAAAVAETAGEIPEVWLREAGLTHGDVLQKLRARLEL